MKIIPAIDLYNGTCVRLRQGDFNASISYNESPLSQAKTFEEMGAKALHIVDLNAAKEGLPFHFSTISQISQETSLSIQVGGGIRKEKTIEEYLSTGISRCILGTKVLDFSFAKSCIHNFGKEKVIASLDVLDGFVRTEGWQKNSSLSLYDTVANLLCLGFETFLITDISKDGMLNGFNFNLYLDLLKKYPLKLIASGGLKDIEDIRIARLHRFYGAIVGKAFYEGRIDLNEVFKEDEDVKKENHPLFGYSK